MDCHQVLVSPGAPWTPPLAVKWRMSRGRPVVTRVSWGNAGAPHPACPPCEEVPEAIATLVAQILSMLKGQEAKPSLSLADIRALSPFQRAVLRATHAIPWGQTTTYGRLAHAIGRPGAMRAVGRALSANPFPLIVPCHRVVCSDGRLGGFSGPAGMKRRLLLTEGLGMDDSGKVIGLR